MNSKIILSFFWGLFLYQYTCAQSTKPRKQSNSIKPTLQQTFNWIKNEFLSCQYKSRDIHTDCTIIYNEDYPEIYSIIEDQAGSGELYSQKQSIKDNLDCWDTTNLITLDSLTLRLIFHTHQAGCNAYAGGFIGTTLLIIQNIDTNSIKWEDKESFNGSTLVGLKLKGINNSLLGVYNHSVVWSESNHDISLEIKNVVFYFDAYKFYSQPNLKTRFEAAIKHLVKLSSSFSSRDKF